ncbi:MAG: bifunctional (p)ppGpp synthetase/guanosine-3',5'-bis(diphosphate) 3'-pyrophosphohydrolase [Bdellovibrionales bacterium]
MLKQFEMVERIKAYDPDANEDAINRAYIFAMKCHGGQLRASGDPYYSHPVEVASILVEMRLDWQTIIVALLHDTVEDTVATLEDIQRLFGPEIAKMVDGVTKLTRIEYQDEQSKQAENFRKLILAMSADLRVLLVKLADRLHNMRTLHFIPKPDKRKRIARETLDIYAPLAARIGMQQVQDELENIAFSELQSDAYHSITARMAFLREEGEDMAGRIVNELQEVLLSHGVANAQVYGREKSPYSIWRKMQQKNITFEQLMDIMAFRIIVDDVSTCYAVLGIMHSEYHVIPGRFKDYISSPKPNGYKSLHTAIMGPENIRIEIQIRTQQMHDIAEMGVAAHWDYKQGGNIGEGEQFRWLRELVDIVENAQRPEEFLEHTKLELYQDQVFCFSPKGDVVALPRGATPVDFAYAVHSGLGDTCVGAKVNGRIVPLRTELKHGDQVEVITNKNSTPSPAWERFVVTGKARARIRKFIRAQQRTQYVALGKPMLQKIYTQENVAFDEKALTPLLGQFQAQSVEDLYANIGMNYISPREVFYAANPAVKQAEAKKTAAKQAEKAAARAEKTGKLGAATTPLSIKGLLAGMAVHYARCCHPVPGDLIVGIVTTGKGVTIHTHDCATLNSFQNMPERWLDVAWDEAAHGEETIGRLQVMLNNTVGAIATMSGIIAGQNGNITNMKIVSRTPEFYEVIVDIAVEDLRHLLNISAALRADATIQSVERVKGK